jgi:hypothetical protein
MSSWRDQILQQFVPNITRLTLVADPDGLLLEEGILAGIHERGFELIPFEDHVAFRYAYESRFRSRWDRGEQTDLVVVLRSQASDLSNLPYDLLHAGRRLSFSLGDIFPNLSYPIVAALDRGDLDALYDAQCKHAPGPLGDNATKEFALRHVFGVAPELIGQPSELLQVLIRRHYRGQRVPTVFDERFIWLLRQTKVFDDWPLEALVPDREAFFAFVQERWPVFLDHFAALGEPGVSEPRMPYALTYGGPIDLPFEHHDIRVYIQSLFLEGVLRPTPHERASALEKTWVSVGVETDPSKDRVRRLAKLIESLQAAIPAQDARHGDWLHFARGWSEYVLLTNEQDGFLTDSIRKASQSLQAQVDARFVAWLLKRYAGLANLPPVPPVMVHHLPRFMSRHLAAQTDAKVALLLIDGLSMEQWLLIRDAIDTRHTGLHLRENAVFAWIPTLTSISRQATFAGRPPALFPDSILSIDREPALWLRFWADQGLSPSEVVYAKGLGDGSLDGVSEMLSHPKARVAGLVIDKVDRIMHGMELGSAGMHNQVRQWAQQPYLALLLGVLLDRGFRVFLTSDHGNIEARGCGLPGEGAIADLRGERVRVYPDRLLRTKVKGCFPSALEWEPLGLPDDYLALLAADRQAFVREGAHIVCHGGISVEEVIVPLIEIERATP